jgi:hypothetical protein
MDTKEINNLNLFLTFRQTFRVRQDVRHLSPLQTVNSELTFQACHSNQALEIAKMCSINFVRNVRLTNLSLLSKDCGNF